MKRLVLSLAIFINITHTDILYAAVSGEQLMNVQDSTQTFILAPRRVKDAGDAADSLTKGVMAVGPFVFDGTNWDKARGDATNGLDVDVTRISGSVTMIGDDTPADTYANPSDFVGTWSLTGLFNGTTWDRWLTTTHGDNITTTYGANTAAILYGFDGTNYDRVKVTPVSDGVTVGLLAIGNYVYNSVGGNWSRFRESTVLTGVALVDNSSNASNNITTNTTTAIKATGGVLNSVIVNTAGTTSTAAFYNIASAGCTGTPASGYTFTLPTTTLVIDSNLNHTFTLGICVVTAGTGAADISVLYR